MKLSELLREVECEGRYDGETQITGVTDDTAKVKEGTLFVCIKHRSFDGHFAAVAAIKKGAAAVVTQNFIGVKNEVTVKSSRDAYAKICAEFWHHPENKLKMIAVTGTNGKTTVVSLLQEIYERAGISCASLGTVKNDLGKETLVPEFTTAKPPELYSMLYKMQENGCKVCTMEASSQALKQGRLYGIYFDTAVFTNITPEHLDYHKSFDDYLKSKLILFKNAEKAIINLDSRYSEEFIKISDFAVTYSAENNNADYTAKNIKLFKDHVSYELLSKYQIIHIEYPSLGLISVYNSMAAAVTALENGIDVKTIQYALKNSKRVEGRMEELNLDTAFKIYIDYAHTQDSLHQVLFTLRQICEGRLIVLFGCGGDRDKEKRPLMFETACSIADTVIVTSDNPRTEDACAIINDILKGKRKKKCQVITELDRRKAIRIAVKIAKKDDILILAGKGHEKYQIIGREKMPFDERVEVSKALAEVRNIRGDEI